MEQGRRAGDPVPGERWGHAVAKAPRVRPSEVDRGGDKELARAARVVRPSVRPKNNIDV